MFVHARASPFNQRTPRLGPDMAARDYSHKPPKPADTPKPQHQPAASSKESLLLLRPIATNSRIKQHKNLYIVFVNNAFHQLERGDREPYDELVVQFSPRTIQDGVVSSHQLRQWLNALSHVVSQFSRPHAALVDAIVSLPWYTMDDAFVKVYKNFVAILVSAKPEYLRSVLSRTVQSLTHQPGLKLSGDQDEKPLTRGAMFDRLHTLLQSLMELIPTLPSILQPLLSQHFPHKRQNKLSHVTYIRNLLRVSDYCPGVSEEIIATIIDRAIQIDVEVQVDIEELEAEDPMAEPEVFSFEDLVTEEDGDESENDDRDENDMDDVLSDISSEADDLDDDKRGPEQRDTAHIRDMISKLDVILKLIFEHFSRLQDSIASPTDGAVVEDLIELRRTQFLSLVTIFDNIILRTFKSRHTQFVVFWYASLDPEFADLFLGMLVSRALREKEQPPVTRVAAASYIASLVSRATFIGRDATRKVTELFCTYLTHHLAAEAHPHERHTIFYAVAQAVFLIFCFRWRDLLVEEDDDPEDDESADVLAGVHAPRKRRWLPGMDVMQRVVTSPLNPLKICSPNVVTQFASVAQHTGFLYCYPITEGATSQGNASDGATQLWIDADAEQELHSFFPFDPYELPESSSFVHGIYRDWSMVAIDVGDEEDEDDDDDDDDIQEREGRYQEDDTAAALGASFGGMSISPAQTRTLGRPSS